MASVDQIVTKLEDLSEEVCSEKVTVRNKAVDQLKALFDGNLTTVQEVLSGATPSSLLPKYVFSNVFNGLLKHASRQEQTQTGGSSQRADNKAPLFITIIQYLIDYCNQAEANRIPTSLIFDSILKIFDDGFYSRHYGVQFLKILTVYLSNPNQSNFYNIDKVLWKRLLEGCRQMFECSPEGPRNHSIHCFEHIIQLSKHSYLSDVLVEFVPFVESLFDSAEKNGTINSVLRIGFHMTKMLSVSYQYEMQLFAANVCHIVCKSYKNNMSNDLKTDIFEYLHLVMVIHKPLHLGAQKITDEFKASDWNTILESIEATVDLEINYLNEYKFTRDLPVLPESLLSCAAYYYYLIIRYPEKSATIDLVSDDEEVRTEKRIRKCSDMEELLHKVRPSDKKINWRWFVVLGQVLNTLPILELNHGEIGEILQVCCDSAETFSFDIQFTAMYQMCQWLIKSPTKMSWEELTNSIYKCAIKTSSQHSMEVLQLVIANDLLSQSLIIQMFNHITSNPIDSMNLNTMVLLSQTRVFKEVLNSPQVEKDMIGKYLNSSGHLILNRSNYSSVIDFVFTLLEIPFKRDPNYNIPKCCEETEFQKEIKTISKGIAFKQMLNTEEQEADHETDQHQEHILITDINKSILRRLFKVAFVEVKESANHTASVTQLMLRQLEFATLFLNRLAHVIDITKASEILEDLFVKLEGNLMALKVSFESQISEEETVIIKILECLNNFLSVSYLNDLKPVLISSGFLAQAAIWTHHQLCTKGGAIKRNSLVISNIILMGSIQDNILKDYWFEKDINALANVATALETLKGLTRIKPNMSLAKIAIVELEAIFSSHHKNEKISLMILDLLTELLPLFRAHPNSITEWDKFVKQFILWCCKPKYSPHMTLKLLMFYERFYKIFLDHRHLNVELTDFISESFSRFIQSKNFAIQSETVQVLIRICEINIKFGNSGPIMSFNSVTDYCQLVCDLARNLQLNDLLEIDNSGGNSRVAKDDIQNQVAVIQNLLFGVAKNNVLLERDLIRMSLKFFDRNQNLPQRPLDKTITTIVQKHLTFLVSSWLSDDLPMDRFPYFLCGCQNADEFFRNFESEIKIAVITTRSWSEYTNLCEAKCWQIKSDKFVNRVSTLLLLELSSQMKKNIEKLMDQSHTNLTKFQFERLIDMLQTIHELYYDEEQFRKTYKFSLIPEDENNNGLQFDNKRYHDAIQKLNTTTSEKRIPFITHTCMKHPLSVMFLMGHLQDLVHSARFTLDLLQALLKYFKFSELLLEFVEESFDNDQFISYKEYFVKDVVLFVLHVVTSKKIIPNAVKICILQFLADYMKKTAHQVPEMYNKILNRIVCQLIGLAMGNDNEIQLCELIANTLKFFFDDKKEDFAHILPNLEVLPMNHPSFEYVSTIQLAYKRETIQEELERFLALPKRRIHSFRYLRNRITENQEEFVRLFEKTNCRNIPNPDHITHRFIISLLGYIKDKDAEQEIRNEASKILGDFGPIALTTIVLRPNVYRKDFSEVFLSQSKVVSYFLPELVDALQDLQYQYFPMMSHEIIKALTNVLKQEEASSLLLSRLDLMIFLQVTGSDDKFFDTQTDVYNVELFSEFTVNPFSKITVDEWLQKNALSVLSYLSNTCLYRVVQKNPSFGRTVLPLLVTIVLSLKCETTNAAFGETINNFFRDFQSKQAQGSPENKTCVPLILNKDLLTAVIDLVEVIRIFNHNYAETVDINYLAVASAAQYCGLHSNAILYGELWVQQETFYKKCQEKQLPLSGLRQIMIPSYEALEVVDAMKPYLDLNHSRHKYYLLEDAWEFAHLELATVNLPQNQQLQRQFSSTNFNESETNYEAIWRMGDWSQLKSSSANGVDDFQKLHCFALQSLHNLSQLKAKLSIRSARNFVLDEIAEKSLNCSKDVYDSLTALKQIQQIDDILIESRDWKSIIEKWKNFDEIETNSFEQQEEILVQRVKILQSDAKGSSRSIVDKCLKSTVLRLITLAKETRNFRVAVTNLKILENMELDLESKSRMILEDGHLQFLAGHSKLANHLYMRLIHDEEFKDTFGKISALRLMAEYLTENLMVNPNEILQEYLSPAEKLYSAYMQNVVNKPRITKTMVEERVKINDTIAKFADTIYTQRNNYMKSSEYAEKEKLHKESKTEFNQMSKTGLTKAEQLRAHNLRQTILLEGNQLKTVASERDKYLGLAVKLYTKSCELSEGLNDLRVCRIVSLWFTNINVVSIGEFLQTNLPKIPSYKFLIILPQIAARLSHGDRVLTQTISDTLTRCCRDHPHQSIYHVLALYNAYEDSDKSKMSSSMKTRLSNTKLIVDKLLADPKVGKIVKAAQKLSLALIRLANREVTGDSDMKIGSELLSMDDIYRIATPTMDLPVQLNRQYSIFPYITNWVPNFRMVGGINAPKKLTFRCSDGVSRSILAKGKDDLRQDAVMQQVFHFMNILLKSKKTASQRNLSIRTYKIVPLTQMSGILEFCDNTNTLGDYLVSAHEKYHPEDMKVNQCRKMLAECAKKTAEEKQSAYDKVCRSLRPVFHHFFTENFLNPVEWFEKRMFYINSVATTSMVGYIMGIGDRHVNNILIDKSTAEVIHIDFGIALERGKLLPTPERVPFRLTRDLVAAMGCFGLDGLFRTSCEITMQVLRDNKALINTIVEVFLYDPLYTWLSNKKVSKEDHDDDEKNALATRVLIRLNEKLNGRDENDATTIENQVERLIRQAVSPGNLSQMFYGWQPYL